MFSNKKKSDKEGDTEGTSGAPKSLLLGRAIEVVEVKPSLSGGETGNVSSSEANQKRLRWQVANDRDAHSYFLRLKAEAEILKRASLAAEALLEERVRKRKSQKKDWFEE